MKAEANKVDFESEILALCRAKLDAIAPRLAELGVSAQDPFITRQTAEGSNYESEITLYFIDEGGICDGIEFFVYRGGRPDVSKAEVEAWLSETLEDVVARRRRKSH